jgi:phage shock protein A
MFDNLRRAFREAIDNFQEELARGDVPEAVDDLLRQMKREAADTKADVARLDQERQRTDREALKEKKEGQTCRRREKMASDIDDAETAELAREFAEKHERRQKVLENKSVALKEELEMRRGEFVEMIEAIKDAEMNRETLTATAGRASARNSIEGVDELFSELDRIADEIGDEAARGEASREVDDSMAAGRGSSFEDEPDKGLGKEPGKRPIDVDARLEALKRAMGETDGTDS